MEGVRHTDSDGDRCESLGVLPEVTSSRGGGGGGGGGGRGGYLLQWHASWHSSLTFSATVREHDLWSSPLWRGRMEEKERERH